MVVRSVTARENADAGLEPGDGPEPEGRAGLLVVRIGRKRHPEVDVARRERKPGRHHADHRPLASVEPNGATDRVAVAGEEPQPEAVADHDDAITTRLVFARREPAAQGRAHAQHGEHVRRRDEGADPLRLTLVLAATRREVVATGVVRGHRGEHAVLVAQVGVVRPRVQVFLEARAAVVHPDLDEPVGLGVGERTEDDGVHDAEDRGRGPDA